MTAGSLPRRRAFVDVLRERASQPHQLTSRTLAFEPSRMQRTVEELRRLGDRTARPPSPPVLEETLWSVCAAWRANGSLEAVRGRDLRRTPWVLFYPRRPEGNWLAHDERFLHAWLSWLDERENPRAVTALMREFLSVYPEGLPSFQKIRVALERKLRDAKSPRLVRWRERSQEFGLLDRMGPSRLVERWPTSRAAVEEYLESAGLGGLEASHFVEKATEHLLEQMESQLGQTSTGLVLARLLQWLEKDGKLRFESLKVRTATALLSPFLNHAPQPELQEEIRSFLCRTIGDPRIRRPAWQGVPEEVRNVLFRWQVSVALEDFFRVLDETALDRHWRYRKAFWSAYLERDLIEDAWVVLGPAAARIARRDLDTKGEGAGRLRQGDQGESSQSVLLMRIAGLTIAEWSHNGRCRIWGEGNRAAPKLYERDYRRPQLMKGNDWDQVHLRAPEGVWQSKVARHIAHECGIRLSPREYMP